MAEMPSKAVNGALLGCFCARLGKDATLFEIVAYSAIMYVERIGIFSLRRS